jgi:hypothetical protein
MIFVSFSIVQKKYLAHEPDLPHMRPQPAFCPLQLFTLTFRKAYTALASYHKQYHDILQCRNVPSISLIHFTDHP